MGGTRALFGRKLNLLLVFVPVVLVLEHVNPGAHTLLFLLSVAAVVPLAGLLSHATEAVAEKTGDAMGGLLSATLGNLTELVIALTALQAGLHDLVRATIAGAIVTNSLFMLGTSFFLGGLRHRVQEYNAANARMQAAMLLLATISLVIPTALTQVEHLDAKAFMPKLSLSLSLILLATYGSALLFSLKTHREVFASAGEGHAEGPRVPMPLALVTLAVVTVLVALVSDVFVGSVQAAAKDLGMSQAFVGFVVVSIVGAAAEMTTAFSCARKNRLDMSVGIALGSASQIALFVAPVLVLASRFVGPAPMDLTFQGGQVLLLLLTTLTISMVVSSGRSAWYVGVQLLAVYAVFATTLSLLP